MSDLQVGSIPEISRKLNQCVAHEHHQKGLVHYVYIYVCMCVCIVEMYVCMYVCRCYLHWLRLQQRT